MAKKSGNLLGLLAYFVVVVTIALTILSAFGIGGGILGMITQLLLTTVVLWVGWDYAKGLKKTWRIVYIVCAALVVAAIVFGGVYPIILK